MLSVILLWFLEAREILILFIEELGLNSLMKYLCPPKFSGHLKNDACKPKEKAIF